MNNQSPPQTGNDTRHATGGGIRWLSVVFELRSIHPRTIFACFLALMCIPILLILDILFFQFTRPTCAACTNLSEFLTQSSNTLAFIQSNKALTDVLHIYKKLL